MKTWRGFGKFPPPRPPPELITNLRQELDCLEELVVVVDNNIAALCLPRLWSIVTVLLLS